MTRLQICPLYILKETNKATDGTTRDLNIGDSPGFGFDSGPNLQPWMIEKLSFFLEKLGVIGCVYEEMILDWIWKDLVVDRPNLTWAS